MPLDPADFARQERLRKQREKQAKFQQDIIKRKQLESKNYSAFKENNLLVEDGDDMWDVLSQIPDNIENYSSSPKRKRSCTVDFVEHRKSPRLLQQNRVYRWLVDVWTWLVWYLDCDLIALFLLNCILFYFLQCVVMILWFKSWIELEFMLKPIKLKGEKEGCKTV